MAKPGSNIVSGTVTSVTLSDLDVNSVYSIGVRTGGVGTPIVAYPLDANIKRIPLVGEQVVVIKSTSPGKFPGKQTTRSYYLNPTSVQLNVHNNLLPNANAVGFAGSGIGIPNGFEERDDVGSLQPFLGDVLIEGRFGHSLRFGYTPILARTTKRPSWLAPGKVSEPITILSNGRKTGGRYNKFIIEDVNDDLSSIWLTSKQQVKLKPSQKKIGDGVKNPNLWKDPSIVLNSDRLFLNARDERVIISGKKDIINATPKWAMEMDKFFDLMEKLVSELVDLTSAKATYATGVGPTGPATNAAKVKVIFDELKKMKQ